MSTHLLTAVLLAISASAFAKTDTVLPGLPGGRQIVIKPSIPAIQVVPMHTLEAILPEAVQKGAAVIDVSAARCDSRGTDCDIQSLSNLGKHIAFEVVKGKGIVFVSSSGRKYPVVNRTARDEQIMLSLGVALERVADRCKSIVIVKMEYGQLSTPSARIEAIALQPGCVL